MATAVNVNVDVDVKVSRKPIWQVVPQSAYGVTRVGSYRITAGGKSVGPFHATSATEAFAMRNTLLDSMQSVTDAKPIVEFCIGNAATDGSSDTPAERVAKKAKAEYVELVTTAQSHSEDEIATKLARAGKSPDQLLADIERYEGRKRAGVNLAEAGRIEREDVAIVKQQTAKANEDRAVAAAMVKAATSALEQIDGQITALTEQHRSLMRDASALRGAAVDHLAKTAAPDATDPNDPAQFRMAGEVVAQPTINPSDIRNRPLAGVR